MLFSFDWIRQYVDSPADVHEVAEALTSAGLAVEGIEARGDDFLLDVDVTTNRPDCMCHLGLAREVAVLFDRPLRAPGVELRELDRSVSEVVEISVEDAVDCPRYVGRVVEGVRVGPSPGWLADRLLAVGLRPINNVVDVTNFVLWELGQPIHAFDLRTLSAGRVVVRRARPGEMLLTLDGERRTLEPEVLVIADAARAVALAGIMGGLDSEVTSSTTDVLIESAHFDPRLVRQGARLLDLRSDASHRFERGADPEICRRAADRVAALLAEVAEGRVLAGALDERSERSWRSRGRLDGERLERFGGLEVADGDIERWAQGLGFDLEPEAGRVWSVSVPPWRFYDFRRDPSRGAEQDQGEVWEADLFEEILRIKGYDAIPAALPPVEGPDVGSSESHRRRERIRHHLASAGYTEAITYAFHDGDSERTFPALERRGEPLRLANPLSELYSVMRRSLVPGLLAAARFNLRRGAEEVRLFEVGHVFPGADAAEFDVVSLLGGGTRGTPWSCRQSYDLFDLKGAVESLFHRFGLTVKACSATLPGFLEGTGSELVSGGGEQRVVGFMGQLDDRESSCPLFAAELRGDLLGSEPVRAVEVPSRFPTVEADLTLTHPVEIPWAEIAAEIAAAEVEDLADFGLKDRYRGEGVPAGAVNTTIFFVYNAVDRSLTQEEVNARHGSVARRLESRFGWKG